MSVVENLGVILGGIVDIGASCHITGIWRVFLIITEMVPGRLVESEGGMARVVRGVGRIRL